MASLRMNSEQMPPAPLVLSNRAQSQLNQREDASNAKQLKAELFLGVSVHLKSMGDGRSRRDDDMAVDVVIPLATTTNTTTPASSCIRQHHRRHHHPLNLLRSFVDLALYRLIPPKEITVIDMISSE